jgi:uncharacterized protein
MTLPTEAPIGKPPIALITGASSGLGVDFAAQLSRRGYELVITARRADRLDAVKTAIVAERPATKVTVIAGDLANSEFRTKLAQQIKQQVGDVSLLVNNAGFGSVGAFSNQAATRQLEMVELNCAAVVHLCSIFVSRMLERRSGGIINVCSTAAFQPLPYMAVYGATKSFLLNYSVALAAELSSSGIHVMAHCPGPTKTEFHLASGLPDKISLLPAMDSAVVVEQALRGYFKRKKIVVNGVSNRFLASLNRVMSLQTASLIVERMLRPYGRTNGSP